MALPCFIANWKMNKTVDETLLYLAIFQKRLSDFPLQDKVSDWIEVILAPPYTSLFSAGNKIKELSLPIGLAGQNFYFESEGPYTGEVSSRMLCDAGCQYVIIGHSERRNHFGEDDFVIGQKVQSAMGAGLIPILCVGESAKERQEGRTLEVVKRQVKEGFCRVDEKSRFALSQSIIAYEPVWAIGTGKTPTPCEVEQVHQEIARVSSGARVLYGGSVNEENVAAFMKEPHLNGMLVGGASLSAETFVNIIQRGMVGHGLCAPAQ